MRSNALISAWNHLVGDRTGDRAGGDRFPPSFFDVSDLAPMEANDKIDAAIQSAADKVSSMHEPIRSNRTITSIELSLVGGSGLGVWFESPAQVPGQ